MVSSQSLGSPLLPLTRKYDFGWLVGITTEVYGCGVKKLIICMLISKEKMAAQREKGSSQLPKGMI